MDIYLFIFITMYKPPRLEYALAGTLPYSKSTSTNKWRWRIQAAKINNLWKEYMNTLTTIYKNEPIPVEFFNPWALTESETTEAELTIPYYTKQILRLPDDSTTEHVTATSHWGETMIGQSEYLYERRYNPLYKCISTIHLPAYKSRWLYYNPKYQTLVLNVRADVSKATSPQTETQRSQSPRPAIPANRFRQLDPADSNRKLRDERAINVAIGAAKLKDPALLVSAAKAYLHSF